MAIALLRIVAFQNPTVGHSPSRALEIIRNSYRLASSLRALRAYPKNNGMVIVQRPD